MSTDPKQSPSEGSQCAGCGHDHHVTCWCGCSQFFPGLYDSLQAEVASLRAENERLRARVCEQEEDITRHQGAADALRAKLDGLQQQVAADDESLRAALGTDTGDLTPSVDIVRALRAELQAEKELRPALFHALPKDGEGPPQAWCTFCEWKGTWDEGPQHVRECEHHPMAQLRAELEKARAVLPCGHPESLALRSVESATVLCELCEAKNHARDAETMERELTATAERERKRAEGARALAADNESAFWEQKRRADAAEARVATLTQELREARAEVMDYRSVVAACEKAEKERDEARAALVPMASLLRIAEIGRPIRAEAAKEVLDAAEPIFKRALTSDSSTPKGGACPKCGGMETTFGYGLAGGGIGGYRLCLNEACGELFDKVQDDDGGSR